MRLMQDQPWYILNNYLYAEKVKNTAVSHEIGGQKKEASVLTDIERDYTLTKRAYFGGRRCWMERNRGYFGRGM